MSYAPVRLSAWRALPSGAAAVETTVQTMRQLARAGATHPLPAETAAGIVGGAGSDVEAAEAIRAFLVEHVEFQYDPPDVELLRTPRAMLREIELHGVTEGDCDDVATLGAALGLAVGIPARFVLLSFTPAGPYEHVYAELLTHRGPVELDTTRPAQLPPGLRVYRHSYREA